jgi:ABC-type branched-subunit amino acid transport system substrate-binding protein
MRSTRALTKTSGTIAAFFVLAAGCNTIVGLDKITVGADSLAGSAGASGTHTGGAPDDPGGAPAGGADGSNGGAVAFGDGGAAGAAEPVDDCKTNQECIDRASVGAKSGAGGGPAVVASVCVKQGGAHCVPLASPDCTVVTGDYTNDQAIVVGSLFSITGTTAASNIARQNSAQLAIEQINQAGGVPSGSTSANPRPLVLVACDETNLASAAGHLVHDLHVPAIVGPNTSQDTLDVSTKYTVPGGTVVMSPTGVASSIAMLADNDLTWLMVPSDVQRAPLMIGQINAIEKDLKTARPTQPVKLGIIFRNDALGTGTRTALNDLMLNGASLSNSINLGMNVRIDPYNFADATQQPIIDAYAGTPQTPAFAPDIIVLAGTTEAVTKILTPLEAAWPANTPRPQYVLIDSSKVPELLTAVTGNDDLRKRIRGTGITPGPGGKNTPAETFTGFQLDYAARFNGMSATTSGMGPSHDAAYAIGLALAATTDMPVSGKSVAIGLRKLAAGNITLEASGVNVLAAFQKLSMGQQITAVGTFGILDWDSNGAVKGGTLEMWCVGGPSTKPVYGSSGLTFDVRTQTQTGTYVQCP